MDAIGPSPSSSTPPSSQPVNLVDLVKRADTNVGVAALEEALKTGADPNADGGLALVRAVKLGRADAAAVLREHGATCVVDKSKDPAFQEKMKYLPAYAKSKEMLRALLSRPNHGWDLAACVRHLCMSYRGACLTLSCLIREHGATLTPDENGLHPIHLAAINGHEMLVAALIQELSVSVDLADGQGNTPLHHAMANNAAAVACLLCSENADITLRNKEGRTPLNLIPWIKPSSLPIGRVEPFDDLSQPFNTLHLVHVRGGVRLVSRDSRGKTLLHDYVEQVGTGESLRWWPHIYVAYNPELLQELKWIIDTQDDRGRTALHYAAERQDLITSSWLIVEVGARTDIRDEDGKLPQDLCEEPLPPPQSLGADQPPKDPPKTDELKPPAGTPDRLDKPKTPASGSSQGFSSSRIPALAIGGILAVASLYGLWQIRQRFLVQGNLANYVNIKG